MTPEEWAQFNIVALMLAPLVGAFASKDGERGFNAFFVTCFVLSLSGICWAAFVIAHFVGKYW